MTPNKIVINKIQKIINNKLKDKTFKEAGFERKESRDPIDLEIIYTLTRYFPDVFKETIEEVGLCPYIYRLKVDILTTDERIWENKYIKSVTVKKLYRRIESGKVEYFPGQDGGCFEILE